MNPTNNQIEREEAWKRQIENEDVVLTITHNKREFTFTQTEARQLLKVATMQAMCQALIDDMINNTVLPRIGIFPSKEKKVLWEPNLGRFVIWELKEPLPTPTSPKPKKAKKS